MPIPRNWSEELACEWLCLEGIQQKLVFLSIKALAVGEMRLMLLALKVKM